MAKQVNLLQHYYLDGVKLEVGLDESGRGSYLGRMYAGAVFWDPETSSPLIKDSKELTPRQRLIAYDFIKEYAPAYGHGWVEVDEIEQLGLNPCNTLIMYRAIKDCDIIPEHILIDGDKKAFKNFLYKSQFGDSIGHSIIPQGDSKYMSIAAASIIAKVERDKYIEKLCDDHPYLDVYNIRSNKGYGAKVHEEALAHWGITKFHRVSYKSVSPYADKVFTG